VTDAKLCWFELRWPREVAAGQLIEALRALATSRATPIVIETTGMQSGVIHRMALPTAPSGTLIEHLGVAVPGIGFARLARRPPITIDRAVEVRMTTAGRPLRSDDAQSVNRTLLTALNAVRSGEMVVLQWQLVGALAPSSVGNHTDIPGSVVTNLSRSLLGGRTELDAERRGALRSKRSLPGWRVVGRVGVRAERPARQRQLIGQVLSALRSAEGPSAHFRLRSRSVGSIVATKKPWRVPMRLNIAELAAVSSWPAGDTRSLPVSRQSAKVLAPARAVRERGRVLGIATFPGRERPVAIQHESLPQGVHVLGPTGTGKSSLLLNGLSQSIAAGYSVVAVDSKGDLARDTLSCVGNRVDDVVLIDPTDPVAVVGVNPLANSAHSAELVADRLLHIFAQTSTSWGPRLNDILFNALATLARTPGMSLACLPLLLGEPGFRRRVVGALDEPLVLRPFWSSFESWSEAERATAIAPILTRVRPLLVRPDLRALLGQAEPHFDLSRALSERKIVLVSVAKGQLGPEGAALTGSIVVSLLWQAALERSADPASRRYPVHIFIDEFQDFVHGVTDFAEALSQSRGMNVSWTLAHQHLAQLSPSLRSALVNARSRVVFQLAGEDARTLGAADGILKPDDFRSLGAYEAYAQIVADNTVQPWLSLRTLPPPPVTSDPERVRQRSRALYAVSREQVDLDLHRLRDGARADDLGPKPRAGGVR
jgi:hypothetical protein